MEKITAVIVAGGSGTRMGAGINKVFIEISGKCVIEHTVDVFRKCEKIDDIVIVTRECDIPKMKSIFPDIKVVAGGASRQESVMCGLKVAYDSKWVLIHDAARALITEKTLTDAIDDMKKYKASAVGVKCKDTLKAVDKDGFIEKTLDRETTYQIQTPQCFLYDEILNAHKMAQKDGVEVTDDCAVYEKYMGRIKITDGSYDNLKFTTPEDIAVFEKILSERQDKK